VSSAVDVARELGLNERTVRRAIADGRLHAAKHGRAYEIDPAEAALVCLRPHAAALRDALETLRDVGYGADADAIEQRYGLKAAK
jgi:excisionase family DNA binding protein